MEKEKILIVEDDILSSNNLCKLLKEYGYDVVGIATTKKDAIEKTKALSPNIILIDALTKDYLGGCRAAFYISQNFPKIVIVFLTSYVKKEIIWYAKKSNAYAYLVKPYRYEEILATIEVALWKEKYLTRCQNIIKLKNGFYFNTQTDTLYKEDKQIPLTAIKLKLVKILSKHVDIVLSHEYVSNFIWGKLCEASTLRSLVYRTKQTIGEDLISNISGVGYIIKSK